MVDFITGEKLFFTSVGRLNFIYGYRPNALVDETANATIAPGPMPNNRDTPTDINDFHIVHAHAHKGALRKTARQMSITLVGKMNECKGCSLAKGIRMSIPSKTSDRAVKRLFRVFMDLGGKMHVKSIGGKKYPMTIINDYSPYTWMFFISHKSDAADTYIKFLSDLRLEGIPLEVFVIRSDDEGEFSEGKFGKLCSERNIKHEFTTADSPEYNGVAERGLALIESAALAARIRASELFSGFNNLQGPSLWAEAMNWTCDAYNRTSTLGNSRNRRPHEMLYGEPSQTSLIPFLKPGFCKYKRMNKIDPKTRECFYLSPARNHPSESKRVLVYSRKVVVTRNITWAHVLSVRPVSVQPKPSVEGEHYDWLWNREASSVDGRAMEDGIESVVSSSS